MANIQIPGCHPTGKIISNSNKRILLGGISGAGKGHLPLMTDAPGPIGVIPLDENSVGICNKAIEEGREIIVPTYNFQRRSTGSILRMSLTKTQKDTDQAMKDAQEFLAPVFDMVGKFAAHKDIQTIYIDGIAQLWADVVTAHWGKPAQIMPVQRTGPNLDMQNLLNACGGKNLILSTRVKAVWTGSGNDSKPVPGRWEADCGWTGLDYAVGNCLLQGRIKHGKDINELLEGWTDAKTDKDTILRFKSMKVGDWWAMVAKSHENPLAIGADTLLTNGDITFGNVMDMCSPGWR